MGPEPKDRRSAPPAALDTAELSERLGRVLDEHILWLGRWQRALFFPGAAGADAPADVPRALADWRADAHRSASEIANQPVIDRLQEIEQSMHQQGIALLHQARGGRMPDMGEFDDFMELSQNFVARLRMVERAFNIARSGMDPLTGLKTRAGMTDEINREIKRCERTGGAFSLAVCDIDHFKQVNDRWGHDAGDEVLAVVAGCILRGVRTFDDAWRMGGEEFIISLKDADEGAAMLVLERLRNEIAGLSIPVGEGRRIRVTASFGYATLRPGTSADRMITVADRALYRAKEAGRNRVVLADPADVPDDAAGETSGDAAMAGQSPAEKAGNPV